jgi:hypothetical protein
MIRFVSVRTNIFIGWLMASVSIGVAGDLMERYQQMMEEPLVQQSEPAYTPKALDTASVGSTFIQDVQRLKAMKKDMFESTDEFHKRLETAVKQTNKTIIRLAQINDQRYCIGTAELKAYDADHEVATLQLDVNRSVRNLFPEFVQKNIVVKLSREEAKKLFAHQKLHAVFAELSTSKGTLSLSQFRIRDVVLPRLKTQAALVPQTGSTAPKEHRILAAPSEFDLKRFLESYIHAGTSAAGSDPYDSTAYYTDSVHPYFSIPYARHADIVRDKQRYYRKWPYREYTLTQMTPIDHYTRNGREYDEVIIKMKWIVSSPARGERTGVSVLNLTLVHTGGSYKITGIREATFKDNIPQRNSRDDFVRSRTGTMTFRENGILIEVAYPKMVYAGRPFLLKASMTNLARSARQGGLTLSFPDIERLPGRVVKSNFDSTKGYSYPDPIYDNLTRSKMATQYFMVEGWQKRRWPSGRTKYFTVSLKAPYGRDAFRVNVRGILWIRNKYDTRKAPSSSLISDQQGFGVRQFTIEVRD